MHNVNFSIDKQNWAAKRRKRHCMNCVVNTRQPVPPTASTLCVCMAFQLDRTRVHFVSVIGRLFIAGTNVCVFVSLSCDGTHV